MRIAPLSQLPKGALAIAKEAARHLLRRPVVGLAVCAKTEAGLWVLIRRADTGTWALPGGTVEWGETLRQTLVRELLEEAGIEEVEGVRLVGVVSAPERDPRFHAVTVIAACQARAPVRAPQNPLEIREVGLFSDAELPRPLAMGMDDMLDAAREGCLVFE